MNEPGQLYKDIAKWSGQTFGYNRDVNMILRHLDEELDELVLAIGAIQEGYTRSYSELQEEYADVQILLWNLMARMGTCFDTCMDAVRIKLEQNKSRQWDIVDGKMKHK